MSINLKKLVTENRNKNTMDIDRISTYEMLKKINDEDKKVAIAVENEIPQIAKVIDLSTERLKNDGRIIYIGAGTSGRLGILDASECPPTYGVSHELIQGLIAGGKEAMFIAKEGAEDSEELAILDLKKIELKKNDVLVGLAASGRTPYVIGGLKYANEIGALTVSVACNKNSEIAKEAKIEIAPIVGPEVVTGSTRMKSGTAQKMVLNMISTGIMIRLGKVYENLMVDVKATNDKLVERSKNIVMEATGASREVVEEKLKETNFDVKLSIFIILSKISKEEAKAILDRNNGYISNALNEIK
ncbi:N-acetylmuramic acid 6-phosphate etherase [Eubacterium multiforme]|uniref:N-acetylmuramic acid 6-phosphate etherase n=1 Tax=Eubacterium multiforme TaxID=83339 RepID=A0ABT9UX15_9FIRM|nr:N-acetylmuramic acid 6-phosphate etherase [Eubacterium multiforme]